MAQIARIGRYTVSPRTRRNIWLLFGWSPVRISVRTTTALSEDFYGFFSFSPYKICGSVYLKNNRIRYQFCMSFVHFMLLNVSVT